MNLENLLQIIDLGKISYQEAMRIQNHFYTLRRQRNAPDTVLFLEYPPLITKGRTEAWNKINASPEELAEKNIPVYPEDRGGGTAYLGPGQLIMYNILGLSQLGLSIYAYQRKVEEVAAEIARQLRFPVHCQKEKLEVDTAEGRKGKEYFSVWYRHQGKNCKFFAQGHGIPDRDITKFGAVFYVQAESLRHMHLVNQCGFNKEQVGIVSMEHILSRPVALEEIKQHAATAMQKIFKYQKVNQEVLMHASA